MENKKDRLEELFRRTLGEEAKHSPEGWNEPSPEGWGNIQTGIGSENVPRLGLKFWRGLGIAASLLLLVAAVFIFQNQKEISSLNEQLQASEQEAEIQNQVQNQTQSTENQTFTLENLASGNENPTPDSGNETASGPKSDLTGKLNSEKKENLPNEPAAGLSANTGGTTSAGQTEGQVPSKESGQSVAVEQHSNFPKGDKNSPQSEEDGLAANPPATVAEVPLEKVSTSGVLPSANIPDLLDLAAIQSIARQSASEMILAQPKQIIPKKSISGYVGVVASPQFTLRQTSGPFKRPTRSETTSTFGLQAGISIAPRLRLESGLQRSSSRVLTENLQQVKFRQQDETPNQEGDLQSTYTLALATSAGTTDAEVELARRPDSPVQDGRELPVRVTVAHESRQLDLPLLLNYRLTDGQFSIGLRGGLMARFGLSSTFEVADIEVGLPAFRHNRTRFVGTVRDGKTEGLTLHLLAGLDLDYRLSKHLSISLSPTYAKALEPTASDAQRKVFLNGMQLNAGVRYWL